MKIFYGFIGISLMFSGLTLAAPAPAQKPKQTPIVSLLAFTPETLADRMLVSRGLPILVGALKRLEELAKDYRDGPHFSRMRMGELGFYVSTKLLIKGISQQIELLAQNQEIPFSQRARDRLHHVSLYLGFLGSKEHYTSGEDLYKGIEGALLREKDSLGNAKEAVLPPFRPQEDAAQADDGVPFWMKNTRVKKRSEATDLADTIGGAILHAIAVAPFELATPQEESSKVDPMKETTPGRSVKLVVDGKTVMVMKEAPDSTGAVLHLLEVFQIPFPKSYSRKERASMLTAFWDGVAVAIGKTSGSDIHGDGYIGIMRKAKVDYLGVVANRVVSEKYCGEVASAVRAIDPDTKESNTGRKFELHEMLSKLSVSPCSQALTTDGAKTKESATMQTAAAE